MRLSIYVHYTTIIIYVNLALFEDFDFTKTGVVGGLCLNGNIQSPHLLLLLHVLNNYTTLTIIMCENILNIVQASTTVTHPAEQPC